jgi:hypothetical protein
MIKPYRRHSAECEFGPVGSDGQRHGGLREKLAAKKKLTPEQIDREVRGWKHCRCAVWYAGSWNGRSYPRASTGFDDWEAGEKYCFELMQGKKPDAVESKKVTVAEALRRWHADAATLSCVIRRSYRSASYRAGHCWQQAG